MPPKQQIPNYPNRPIKKINCSLLINNTGWHLTQKNSYERKFGINQSAASNQIYFSKLVGVALDKK
jgi:hypothetical protein